MNKQQNHSLTSTENFLLSLLHKLIKEYKTLLGYTRRSKPFKIIEILNLSSIPGETKFLIQITNKNCFVSISAAEIIHSNYDLNDFSNFHAEMIRQGAKGTLIEYLRISEDGPKYKIISKKYDTTLEQHLFTIETNENIRFTKTAEEVSGDKRILWNIANQDIYDVGYTFGAESVLKEEKYLLLAKHSDNKKNK